MAEDPKPPISTEVIRGEGGRFAPGTKGGPGGRRRMPETELTMLGGAMPKAITALIAALEAEYAVVRAVGPDQQEIEMIPDHDVRIKAANALLDRLYGKPAQAVTGGDGEPLKVDIGLAAMLARLVA